MTAYNRDRSDAGRGAREFGRRNSGRPGHFERNRDFGRSMHKAICDDCGVECEVPFRPSRDKAVYCDECFRKPREEKNWKDRNSSRDSEMESKNNEQWKEQLDSINSKLDKILKMITPVISKEALEKESLKEEETPVKVKPAKTTKKSAKKAE